ncbi:MAG: protoporphyrinogen oxidase [Bacteroidota bacterium]
METDVAIIGAGVTGLSAALRLVGGSPDVRVAVLEAAPRPGGKLRTVREGGFTVDLGPDVFLARRPEATQACTEVGLGEALRPVQGKALIWRRGQLHPLPEGWTGLVPGKIGPLLRSPLLSVAGRLRGAMEPFVPARRSEGDESLESFVQRRFGREVYTHLVEPLVGGLYGSDQPVSVQATLPHLQRMERQGGVVRAWKAQQRTPGPTFFAVEGGMERWPQAQAQALSQHDRAVVRLETPVQSLERVPGGFRLALSDGAMRARAVLVTTSSAAAARLLAPLDPDFVPPLQHIPMGTVEVVALGYAPHQLSRPVPDGTGYLIPRQEGGAIQAVTCYHRKHPGTAPAGHALFRVFVRPQGATAGSEEAVGPAHEHLERVLGVQGAPRFTATWTWKDALPRYTLGHLSRLAALDEVAARYPGVFLAGTCYRGAGLPACVADGWHAAEAAAAHVISTFASLNTD